jgi:hypothetical protein
MPLKDPTARREYHRRYMREWYASDATRRAKHIQKVNSNRARYKSKIRGILDRIKAKGCPLCSERAACCMSFHHLDPTAKEESVGVIICNGWAEARVWKELSKCICVCENCHRKIHAGLLTVPEWLTPIQKPSCGPQS